MTLVIEYALHATHQKMRYMLHMFFTMRDESGVGDDTMWFDGNKTELDQRFEI